MPKKRIHFRLAIVCLATAAVGLSMAIISMAKLLLILCGLGALLLGRRAHASSSPLSGICTPIAVVLAMGALGLSLLWTVAPAADALGSVAKYGKLLLIVLMMLLIRSRQEAVYALGAFALTQSFLLVSAWMLFLQLPVPWATSHKALEEYSVFSSYLDQGIMTAVFAALCWHFRLLVPGRLGRHLAVMVALLALGMVFFVLRGRSGHLVAIALVSAAVMWELPRRYRAGVVLLPFVLALGLYASSTTMRDRVRLVSTEVQSYSADEEPVTSSGIRLNLWHRALQVIGQHPLAGAGVGSWSTEYNRLQGEHNPAHQPIAGNGNPHQEYLLWGVQLGIPGLLIFVGLLLCMWRDTLAMERPYAQAAQSVLLALAVACLFNSSLYDAQIGDFFCILTGLLLALGLARNSAGQASAYPPPKPAT